VALIGKYLALIAKESHTIIPCRAGNKTAGVAFIRIVCDRNYTLLYIR
jgi:hypothetical protein